MSRQTAKSIVKGTLALSLSAIFVKILGVVYKIPLSYMLGDEGMGYFNAAYSVYALFYVICTAGVPKAVALLITEAGTRENTREERAIFNTGMKLFLFFSMFLTALFLFLSPVLSSIVGSSKATAAMIVIAPSIIFTSLCGVMRGYLTGKLTLMPIAFSQLIEAASKPALGLVFARVAIRLGLALPLIAAFSIMGITIGSVASCIFLYIYSNIILSKDISRQKLLIGKKELAKRIFKISVPISLGSSFLSISGLVDVSLITHRLTDIGYVPEDAVSLYGNYSTLALPMINLLMAVLTPISVSALPKLTEHYLKKDYPKLEKTLNVTLTVSTILCAPCAVAYMLYGFEILDILYSSQSSVKGAEALSILSMAVYLLCILTVVNTYHEATGKVRVSVISLILGCFVKIVFGFILIGYPSIGINGAAMATVISYFASLVYSLSRLERKKVKLRKVKSSVLPFSAAFVSFFIPYILLYKTGTLGYNFVSIFLLMIISVILYLMAVLVLGYRKMLFKN